jgi:enoyl-CoA hydratase
MVLLRDRHDAIEVLTLNRPASANAMDPELLGALSDAFDDVDRDDRVHAVVLTGAGDRHFCAGMDLTSVTSHDRSGRDVFQRPCAKPLVAAVNGAAVGGGFELVLACDLAVAAEGARFGMPEVRRGLVAGGGGTLLGTRIPLALALEIGLTGELVDARRVAEWGLVNRVVPAGRLMETAMQLAAAVAANGPLAVRTTKRLMRRAVTEGPEGGWGSAEELAVVFRSEDAREGATAFVEKRKPVWTGR